MLVGSTLEPHYRIERNWIHMKIKKSRSIKLLIASFVFDVVSFAFTRC
jgi:hypothetical protein